VLDGSHTSQWVAHLFQRVTLLQEDFGGLPDVRIGHRIACWKVIWVYFPTQVEFFNLELICPVQIKSPKTGQKVPNEAAWKKSVVAVNFWMPSSTPNWAHDSSLESSLFLVIMLPIMQVIWPTKLGENVIFPRSLQRCLWFSWDKCILDMSLKPWNLCKTWRRICFLGMFWTITSLSFPKFIFDCSETSFEWNLSRCVKQGILSKWSEMKGIGDF